LRKTFDTIILEGGSLKCSFTAGILDVLLDTGFPEFENYYGVSSGSMAMSYFIAKQRKNFVKVTRALVEDSDFLSYTNTFSAQGMMDLDFLEKYVRDTFPFDEQAADANSEGKNIRIITTDKLTGKPYYLRPKGETWIKFMMASGTLPFITKGKTMVDGTWIPVREAIKQGSKNILVIRTRPADIKIDKSYISLMAEYWNYDNEAISDLFHNSYKIYNDCVDFLKGDKPKGVNWHVLAPDVDLKCDGYYLYKEDVDSDYRTGLEVGMDFIQEWKKAK
jgi:predicted patatin/cPLA2 family phospholipase